MGVGKRRGRGRARLQVSGLWMRAKWSSSVDDKGQIKRDSGSFAVFELVGEDSEGERLGRRQGFLAGAAVDYDSGKIDDLCDPAAISLSVEFDREFHGLQGSTRPRGRKLCSLRSRDRPDQTLSRTAALPSDPHPWPFGPEGRSRRGLPAPGAAAWPGRPRGR